MSRRKNEHQEVDNSYGVHSLDFLGEKFSLTYKTANGKFQTTFGGYLTIFLGVASVLVSILIFSQLFNTQAPVVTTYLEFGSKFAKYNLIDEDIVFPLAFAYQGKIISNLSKYVTLKVATTYFRQNKTTGKIQAGVKHLFDFIPCNQVKNQRLKNLMTKFDKGLSLVSKAFCPDFRGLEDEYFVQYDQPNFDHISIKMYVYPCSLPDQSQCASKESINQIRMTYPVLDKFFVSSDKDDPLRELTKKSFARIGSINTKYQDFELKVNRLLDDTSQFTSPRVTKEFTSAEVVSTDTGSRPSEQLHCPESIINGPRSFMCSPYLRFRFAATGKTSTMSRSYKGIITVMGEFGGVIKVLSFAVFFLYSFYTARKMKSYFSSKIFNLNKTELKRLEDILARDEELCEKEECQKDKVKTKTLEKKEKQKKIEIRRMMDECVESKFSAADMMYKLSMLEVLEDVLFEEHDKTLLPLIIMKRYRNKIKIPKSPKSKKKLDKKITNEQKTKNNKSRISEETPENSISLTSRRNTKIKKTQLHQPQIQNRVHLTPKMTPQKRRSRKDKAHHTEPSQEEARKEIGLHPLGEEENEQGPKNKSKTARIDQDFNQSAIGVGEETPTRKGLFKSESEGSLTIKKPESGFEKAYKKLVSSSPKSEIKRAIRNYMLTNVKNYFKKTQKNSKTVSKAKNFREKINKKTKNAQIYSVRNSKENENQQNSLKIKKILPQTMEAIDEEESQTRSPIHYQHNYAIIQPTSGRLQTDERVDTTLRSFPFSKIESKVSISTPKEAGTLNKINSFKGLLKDLGSLNSEDRPFTLKEKGLKKARIRMLRHQSKLPRAKDSKKISKLPSCSLRLIQEPFKREENGTPVKSREVDSAQILA